MHYQPEKFLLIVDVTAQKLTCHTYLKPTLCSTIKQFSFVRFCCEHSYGFARISPLNLMAPGHKFERTGKPIHSYLSIHREDKK
jgi:hypothetical protein